MATSITKTYTVKVKYSRDDGVDLAADFLTYTELKSFIKKGLGELVEAQKGIVSSHLVSISEA